MKISKLALTRLRNAEHFQFLTDVKNLFTSTGTIQGKVSKLSNEYFRLYAVEDECLVILQKSNYTEQMVEADRRRDNAFSALVMTVNTGLKHFKNEIKESAKRLKILLDTYGNLSKKPDKEETSGIYNLVQDIETKYNVDIRTISANEWVTELKDSNLLYETLMNERYDESADKPSVKMREVRLEIDEVYRNMTVAIESLAQLTDDATEIEEFAAYIGKLNVIIAEYKNGIAQRDGINAAKREDEEEEEFN